MTVQLSVDVQGADRVKKGMSAAPGEIASATKGAMTTSLLLLEADQRKHVAMDTRRLMGSIHHTIKGSGGNLTGQVGPSVRYAYWVEHGRKAGKRPPIAAIEGWARRHGANPFQVAKAIGRRGTKAQPFVAPSYTRNRARINKLFADIGAKVVARVIRG